MLAAFVLVWFGSPPQWARLSLETMMENRGLSWLIFTDRPREWGPLPNNVQMTPLNASQFAQLALRTTGIRANVAGTQAGYKVCDWRMAYGEIFTHWLRQFDFWGWVDMDVFLGRLVVFGFNATSLSAHDAVGEHGWPSQGPLMLLRNSPLVNRLWRRIPGVAARLRRPNIQRLNEWAFSRVLLLAQKEDGLRRQLIGHPIHLTAHRRHRVGDLVWSTGRLWHLPSCGEAAYFHFSRWKVAIATTSGSVAEALVRERASGSSREVAWIVGPRGVEPVDDSTAARLANCRTLRREAARVVWDWPQGVTPEQVYRSRSDGEV